MKIAFVGNCCSVFIKQLSEELRKFNDIEELYCFMYNKPKAMMISHGLNELIYPRLSSNSYGSFFLKTIVRPFRYLDIKSSFKRLRNVDIINIHYLSPINLYFWNDIRSKGKKVVISLWGSDFYQADSKTRNRLRRIIRECDALTFTNEKMAIDFRDFYKDLHLDGKIYICRFGLKPLECIKNISATTKERAKELLGFPKDKLVVMVGYSATPNHQHVKVIKILAGLDRSLLKNIFFLFPMTYGDDKYLLKMEGILKEMNFDFKILKEFMNCDKVAMLRVATDIMIHVPLTDQFSGTMQENMFAGNIVVTGDWLPYDILWNSGVFAIRIKSISELKETLAYVIYNISSLRNKCKVNREIIWKLSSWESNIEEWIKMYTRIAGSF